MKTALECLDTAALLSYWIIYDQGSKDRSPDALVEGGQGLMTYHGLRKPAYYALQMLCCLRGRVAARTRNAIAAMDAAGTLRILCHNYKHPDAAYFSDSANETQRSYEVAFEDLRPLEMHIGVQGLPAARYAVEEAWLEDADCSLTAAAAAYPIPPEQMSQLRHIVRRLDTAAAPMAAWEPSIAPRAGMLHLHRTLAPHEVRLLTLFPASSQKP